MKKLFIYRDKNPKWLLNVKVYFYQILGFKVFYWGELNISNKRINLIKFPPSKYCSDYQHRARAMAANYFAKHYENWSGDIYRQDYVKKVIDIAITDYYAFEKTIEEYILKEDHIRIISPSLLYSVYHDKLSSIKLKTLIYYPFWVARLTVILARSICINILSKNKTEVPKIIYIRKKVYPDMGEFQYLSKKLTIMGRKF